MKPKISVIIPVYNAEKYLKRCFDSILNNNYENIEIIPVNDGSKDNSQRIIDEYKQKYPKNFFPIKQENQGIGATRNNGMNIASGDYLMFIDNDDYIDIDYFNNFINALDNEDYDMILGGYRRVTDTETQFSVSFKNYSWSRYIAIGPWARLYKAKYIKENNIKFLVTPIGEDVYFNLQANTLTEKIKIIDYIGYNWYQNGKSVTNTITEKIKKINIINLLDTHYSILEEKKCINEKNHDIISIYFFLLIIQFLQWTSKGSNYKEVSKYYDELFKWLSGKFPEYRKVKCWKLTKGDRLKIRLIIKVMMIGNKLHLGKLMCYMYGKI